MRGGPSKVEEWGGDFGWFNHSLHPETGEAFVVISRRGDLMACSRGELTPAEPVFLTCPLPYVSHSPFLPFTSR